MTIAITGATGQLGRLVVADLARRVPPSSIVSLVRNRAAAADLAEMGVELRIADYNDPATLKSAFAGLDRLLLISSNDLAARVVQHRNAVEAAKAAGVKLTAYTSVLHADVSTLALAAAHRETEAIIAASGLPAIILRNGWYTENYTASIPPALQHGVFLGAAGQGRIASAARADYAEAAAIVLANPEGHIGKVYELAGDSAYTLADFAAEIARRAGKPVAYQNLSQADYKAALQSAGLPEPVAELLSESDAKAALGALDHTGSELSHLIGHPTTPMAETVAAALA